MTMLSRVLGFIRDVSIAQIFGAGPAIDAFFIAFKIPNFMRRIFAEGAFSQAFVPVLSEYQKNETERSLKQFIADMTGNLFIILMLITVFAILLSPFIIKIFAPGFSFSDPRFGHASFMLKLTFPYLLFISLTALSGAILNTFGRFAIPAFTPVILNVVLILSAVFGRSFWAQPVYALACGVLIAGILQYLFQLPFLYRLDLLKRPKVNFKDKGVIKVLKLMVPALFGVSVAQINLLLDTVFASFLPVGSVSWLYYSDRLTFFPLGVFGVAIATVILPTLSRAFASHEMRHYSKALDWSVRMVLLIALPATVGLMIFALPLLITLLGYGKFELHDSIMTMKSLRAFSLGLTAFMLIKVLGSAFYATQNIKTPVKVGVIAMLINTVLCLLFIKPFAHAGLALASSIAGWVNALLLFYFLVKRKIYIKEPGWALYFLKLIVANVVIATLLIFLRDSIAWITISSYLRIMYLILSVSLAIMVYFLTLFVCGIRIKQFRQQ